MTEIYNKTEVTQTRRFLRRKITAPESVIWSKLRNRQLNNSKWRRQYSIGRYVVDFYCPDEKLAIEIDGDNHFNKKAIIHDKNREDYIKSFEVKFLRFTNDEVMKNLEGILTRISENLTFPLLVKERNQ